MSVEGFLSTLGRKPGQPEMRLRDAGPRQGKSRVQRDRVFVSSQSFARTFFGVAIFIKAALQIQLMRVEIFRPAFFRLLHRLLNFLFRRRTRIHSSESTSHSSDDRLRKFGLPRE